MRRVAVHVAGHTLQIAGLAHHVDILLAIQEQTEAAPHQRMVIGEDDPDPGQVLGLRRARCWGKM